MAEKSSGKDPAVISSETSQSFEGRWSELKSRLAIVPGKAVLKQFRQRAQQAFGVSLTEAVIVQAFPQNQLPTELVDLLKKIADFMKTS
jgi:hypothetical protein